MQFNSHRLSAWAACLSFAGLLVVSWGQPALGQAPPAGELSREQDKLARDFVRGRAPATEEAKQALRLKMKAEVDRLKFPAAKNFADAEALAKLADTRANIDAMWVSGARDQAAREVAAEALAVYGRQLLAEDVSPQSKINCMAMLAELDEAGITGAGPPTPSAHAFKVLFAYAGNEQVPLYLRAIALHGLNRHIGRWWPTTHWPDNGRKLLEETLTKIVNSEPTSTLDARAHAWMVRRAYDCLSTMGSPWGASANSAINRLADPKALPSLRLASLEYLSQLDISGFPADKKSLYLVGLAHFTRSQLAEWYEREDNVLRAKSGAMGAGMGGGMMGSSMGGYGDSMGSSMGGYGEGGSSSMGGYGGSMGSSMGGYGGGSASAARKPKPIDTQTWQVRLGRRLVNQISQTVHVALDGVPLPNEQQVAGIKPLKDAQLTADEQAKVAELVSAIEVLQTAVNDPQLVTTMTSLLTQAEGHIEDIMDLVKEVPGFLERYPELTPDDELPTAEDPEANRPAPNAEGQDPALDGPAAPDAPANPVPNGASAPPSAPAAPDDSAAPADDNAAANP